MIIIQLQEYKGAGDSLLFVKPSAAAVYWFLIARGEVEYTNQEELADAVGISYGTFKDGLRELRQQGLVERDKKHIRLLCSEHSTGER
ncbi:helix-turn-helix domain-containing protein [Deinococcus lacus]|uniref:Helix-turn-helix domain-containing protein n=1 Tax=Deinococcus lacus TaxID=392561 RepID=A0ABW1YHP0_9DEIO